MSRRDQILELNRRCNQREIARRLNISVSTVNYWLNMQGEPRKKTGRRRKTTKEQDDEIFEKLQNNSFLTSTELSQDINVCAQTVRNRLAERGFKNYKTLPKPLLLPQNKTKRLEFAYRYQHWTVNDWEKVGFCDEKNFQSYGFGFPRAWRKPNQVVINPIKKSSRFVVKVWGIIGKKIKILHRIKEKTLNSENYMNTILELYIPKHDDEFYLAQDNSSVHSAYKIRDWLNENQVKYLQKWPPYSPDLNPIENIWGILEQMMRNRRPKKEEELWDMIEENFNSLRITNAIEAVIKSMPKRIQSVIANKGDHTKY